MSDGKFSCCENGGAVKNFIIMWGKPAGLNFACISGKILVVNHMKGA